MPHPPDRPGGARGMVTSEYAVGTVGAACIACIMVLLGTGGDDSWLTDLFGRLGGVGGWIQSWDMPWRAQM